MYLLSLLDTFQFRSLSVLIFPLIAIVVIAVMVYLVRSRVGRKRS